MTFTFLEAWNVVSCINSLVSGGVEILCYRKRDRLVSKIVLGRCGWQNILCVTSGRCSLGLEILALWNIELVCGNNRQELCIPNISCNQVMFFYSNISYFKTIGIFQIYRKGMYSFVYWNSTVCQERISTLRIQQRIRQTKSLLLWRIWSRRRDRQ